MDLVKDIRVCKKGTQTGICAEADQPFTIMGGRKILRVCVAEDASA
jgi:hypothetical protein